MVVPVEAMSWPRARARIATPVRVAELALVRAEAECGVALDVLDGLVALPGGQLDVGGRHVELQVDETAWERGSGDADAEPGTARAAVSPRARALPESPAETRPSP